MKKSDIFIIILILIISLSFGMISLFTYKSDSFMSGYAKSKCNNIMSNLINDSISRVINHEEIIIIEKNDNDEVVNLNINNSIVNSMLHSINENIINSIYELENNSNLVYSVPYNVVFDSPLLLYLSPEIPFKIAFLGGVYNKSSINVKSYGINSYLVEVAIDINIELQLVLPFKTENYTMSSNVLLESKIIQGVIPKYYGS